MWRAWSSPGSVELCGDGVEGDAKAERLESADEALAVAVALGEVVAAQILVVELVGEQMPGITRIEWPTGSLALLLAP